MCINIGWTVFLMFDRKFHPWETAALLALCLTLLWGTWAGARQRRLAAGLLRLHVIAVSDEADEQALKLRVRDAVLDYLRPRLAEASDPAEARAILAGELEGVAAAAEQAARGRPVTVTLGPEDYPARSYGGFTLPAGRYESLRVSLGEGRGHNWWCVVFPTLCLDAARPEELRQTLSPEDYALVTRAEGWELRFWLVECWGELVTALR
jgi:stage II sporulation protein R